MDSPLNLAHQQGRKADLLLKSKKYEDAMFCHRRAAEYLLQALELSTSKYAQESIQLQHQFHLGQQDAIQSKIRKLEAIESKLCDKHPSVRNQATQTEDSKLRFALNHFENTDGPSQRNIPDFSGERVLHAMSETDSIVGFLMTRNKHSEYVDSYDRAKVMFTKCQENFPISGPIDYNASIIENLTIQNSDLQKQISLLMKELDSVKKDNRYLTDKVLKSEVQQKNVFEDENGGVAMPDMELPPLEMPQFDFDSLQVSTCDTSSKGGIFSNE